MVAGSNVWVASLYSDWIMPVVEAILSASKQFSVNLCLVKKTGTSRGKMIKWSEISD